MDERLVVDGEIADLKGAFYDASLMPLEEWKRKQLGYAKREAQLSGRLCRLAMELLGTRLRSAWLAIIASPVSRHGGYGKAFGTGAWWTTRLAS